MPYPVLISIGAELDLIEAKQYYSDISHELGEKFIQFFNARVENLSVTPLAGPIRYNTIRCTRLKKFPYIIHYEFNEMEGKIKVFRVLHAAKKSNI